MKAPSFERNKLLRNIRTIGAEYNFQRPVLDSFKEPTGEFTVCAVKGIFHQTIEHINVITDDAASVQSKAIPYILTAFTDALDVQQGDLLQVGPKHYVVTGINNVYNWNIAVDISLEEVKYELPF